MAGILFDKLSDFEAPPVIAGSVWEGNTGMALERRWFPNLSVRAGHVLFDGLKVKTFGELFELDVQTVHDAKNCGVKTCKEILGVRDEMFSLGPEKFKEAIAAEKTCETTNLPRVEVAGLSTRARHFLEAAGITTYAQLFALGPSDISRTGGAGVKTIKELADFAKRMGKEAAKPVITKIEPVDPSNFDSFAEYMTAVAGNACGLSGSRAVVYRDYLSLGTAPVKNTLEKVGQELGVTRERVRQIAQKLLDRIFSEERKPLFAIFEKVVCDLFSSHGWVFRRNDLLDAVRGKFGWTAMSFDNIQGLMSGLGHELSSAAEEFCVLDFELHLEKKYRAFIDYVNFYTGPLSGLSLGGVRMCGGILGDLTELEYGIFVCRGMAYKMTRQRKNGKTMSSVWRIEIMPLRARQYFSHEFNLGVSPHRQGYNKGTLRKDVILTVLREAGHRGLEFEEILARCRLKSPELDWSLNSIRSAAGLGSGLDDVGTHMIGYDRGSNSIEGGNRTTYTLNTFFRDDATVAVLQKAGREVREYMESSGFGIVSVWKVWLKYRKDLPLDLPKLGFYMMMRDIGAAGLVYREYPRIAHPDVEYCESAYHWELYQYFNLAEHPKATYQQIFDFFVECLCIDPALVNGSVIPPMKLDFGSGGWSDGECCIPEPKSADGGCPNVLLANCNIDPELSFSRPRRRNLHMTAEDMDSNGHAKNVLAYVRLFFYNLQESRYCFSSDELTELGDAGWCAEHFGIHIPVVVPLSVSPEMPSSGYWTLPFDFGGIEAWVCSAWNSKRKDKFDLWAARISARAGLDFEPYDL